MRRNSFNFWVLAVLVAGSATWSACDKTNREAASATSAGGGKIPITTKSEDARKEFRVDSRTTVRHRNAHRAPSGLEARLHLTAQALRRTRPPREGNH